MGNFSSKFAGLFKRKKETLAQPEAVRAPSPGKSEPSLRERMLSGPPVPPAVAGPMMPPPPSAPPPKVGTEKIGYAPAVGRPVTGQSAPVPPRPMPPPVPPPVPPPIPPPMPVPKPPVPPVSGPAPLPPPLPTRSAQLGDRASVPKQFTGQPSAEEPTFVPAQREGVAGGKMWVEDAPGAEKVRPPWMSGGRKTQSLKSQPPRPSVPAPAQTKAPSQPPPWVAQPEFSLPPAQPPTNVTPPPAAPAHVMPPKPPVAGPAELSGGQQRPPGDQIPFVPKAPTQFQFRELPVLDAGAESSEVLPHAPVHQPPPANRPPEASGRPVPPKTDYAAPKPVPVIRPSAPAPPVVAPFVPPAPVAAPATPASPMAAPVVPPSPKPAAPVPPQRHAGPQGPVPRTREPVPPAALPLPVVAPQVAKLAPAAAPAPPPAGQGPVVQAARPVQAKAAAPKPATGGPAGQVPVQGPRPTRASTTKGIGQPIGQQMRGIVVPAGVDGPTSLAARRRGSRLWSSLFIFVLVAAAGAAGYFYWLQTRETKLVCQPMLEGYRLSNTAYLMNPIVAEIERLHQSYLERLAPLRQEQGRHEQSVAAAEKLAKDAEAQVAAAKQALAALEVKHKQEAVGMNAQGQEQFEARFKALEAELATTRQNFQKAIAERARSIKIDFGEDPSETEPDIVVSRFRTGLYGAGPGVDRKAEQAWAENQLAQWRTYFEYWKSQRVALQEEFKGSQGQLGNVLERQKAEVEKAREAITKAEQQLRATQEAAASARKALGSGGFDPKAVEAELFVQMDAVPEKFKLAESSERIEGRFVFSRLEDNANVRPGKYVVFFKAWKGDQEYWAFAEADVVHLQVMNVRVFPENLLEKRRMLIEGKFEGQ